MKKILSIVLLSIASTSTLAHNIESAESIAQTFSDSAISDIREALKFTSYDGPYNGEQPVIPCSLNPGNESCLDYKAITYGENAFENVMSNTTQVIENFVFYNAYLNVLASYYQRGRKEYSEFVKSEGKSNLVLKEIVMLKSGQKTLTLRSNLLSAAKEVY